MKSDAFVLAIDQGTTGTTAALFDHKGMPVDRAYREFSQIYPQPGWVEHDPQEIWQTVLETVEELCSRLTGKVSAVGITNQRETTVIWDRTTGEPVYNAIVWQCRRTAELCHRLRLHEPLFRERTGLPVDAYFSGTKIQWILENVPGIDPENLLFGTIDSWLIWKLTQGRVHATDPTNASRTLVYNIRDKRWDPDLCGLLGIPLSLFPEVKGSRDDFGPVTAISALEGVPISGAAGDQQAALFGQTCFDPGSIKNTYGTGCFILMNLGSEMVLSGSGLLTTLAVDGQGRTSYALEASIFIGGAAIQWLRDELGLIVSASESQQAALSVPDNGGVYLVPAFVGLGAPHWNMQARGILTGLTRGSTRGHVVRAALEAMAYQTHDVLSLMEAESGMKVEQLAVDGGAAANDFLLQFQADILQRPVIRPTVIESTSLGAAYLAGLHIGFWQDSGELVRAKEVDREFRPNMDPSVRESLLAGWAHALRQCLVE